MVSNSIIQVFLKWIFWMQNILDSFLFLKPRMEHHLFVLEDKMSKSYDVLSDRQIEIVLFALEELLIRKIPKASVLEINEIISYFENYNSAFNPLDHEQSK